MSVVCLFSLVSCVQPEKRASSDSVNVSPSTEQPKKKKKVSDSHEEYEEAAAADPNDELCEAKHCKRPSKSCAEVEWVQCDDCNLWYHLLCIDLPPHVAHSIETFSCFRCDDKW